MYMYINQIPVIDQLILGTSSLYANYIHVHVDIIS